MNRASRRSPAALALIAVLAAIPATASASAGKTLTVCPHGCKYSTIQSAVDKAKKNYTIDVEPGTYKEGVVVQGHRYDGLTIEGTKKDPSNVVLNGKNAKDSHGQPANNGIETVKADGVTLRNMT